MHHPEFVSGSDRDAKRSWNKFRMTWIRTFETPSFNFIIGSPQTRNFLRQVWLNNNRFRILIFCKLFCHCF